jgi:hypothetical protein
VYSTFCQATWTRLGSKVEAVQLFSLKGRSYPNLFVISTDTLQIRVRSEHLYGSLKGRFGCLRELRFQISDPSRLEYVKLWLITIFILHNLIIRIEAQLDVTPAIWTDDENGESVEEELTDDIDDEYGDAAGEAEYGEGESEDIQARTPGQVFRRRLFQTMDRRGLLGQD